MSNKLEFRLDDWNILKNIFTNINEIIDEIVIECTFDGLKFKGIDRGHVCFFEGNLSKDLFDEYYVDDFMFLYLDLEELVKVLKRGNNKDSLLFKADMEVINVILKSNNNRTFTITQLDIQSEMRDMPKLEYTTIFNCDFDIIKNSLKDADIYSDRLTITCEDNMLILSCDGVKGKYKNEYELEFDGDNCSSVYTISWLSKIFNNKLSSNNLKIHMSGDYPMLIEMSLEFITVNYLLAPRLEQN